MKTIRILGVLFLAFAIIITSCGCEAFPLDEESSRTDTLQTLDQAGTSDNATAGTSPTGATVASPDDVTDKPQGLRLGFGKADITPALPVQLRGQAYDRVATEVHDNLYATAMAMESEYGDTQAIIVSVDNIIIDGGGLIEAVREYVEGKLPGFTDTVNIVLFATHTHTGPWLYDWGDTSAVETTGSEYFEYLAPRIGEAAIAAWSNLDEASVSYMAGSADAGWCRIVRNKDGRDEMYGDPQSVDFEEFTSGSDHSLNLLYCYQGDELKGVVVNTNFPFQSCETETQVSADVAGRLRERFPELYVLPIIGAAGDQSPYDLTKGGVTGQMGFGTRTELGNRLADEIERHIGNGSAYEARQSRLVQAHRVQDIQVTRSLAFGGTNLTIELHGLRLGDVVLVNNPFELYVDYGYEIKAGSMAPVTIIGQLSSNPYNYAGECMYLPTEYAEAGGAYGSENPQVGSAGGGQLVEKTVTFINEMFAAGDTLIVDDTDEGAAYAGSWTSVQDAGAYGRSRQVTETPGSTVEFTFTGTGVKWYDSADTDKGMAEVYLDGELQTTVDEYGPVLLCRKEMFRATGLFDGEHTIRIVCTGQQSGSSSGVKIGADCFVTEQVN